MARTTLAIRTRASALLRPLGRYMRDSDNGEGVTSLLAMRRLASDAAFLSPLWTRPGTELLLRRWRVATLRPSSRA